jgi:hypothetical protein
MKKRIVDAGLHGTWKWDVNKPATPVPIITKEFTRDGIRMYLANGAEYIADIYDKNFTFKKGMVSKKGFVGGRSFG